MIRTTPWKAVSICSHSPEEGAKLKSTLGGLTVLALEFDASNGSILHF